MKKESKTKCVFCGSDKSSVVYDNVNGFQLRRCTNCSLVSTFPVPTQKQLNEMYSSQVLSINGEGENLAEISLKDPSLAKKLRYDKRLETLQKYIRGKSILEVGCGAGVYLNYLQENGYKVTGVEISPWGREWGKKNFKLNILGEDLEKLKLPANSFDAILLYDVLEHTTNPVSFLKEANRILKKQGVLVINSPNFESFMSNLRKEKWVKLIPPQHLFHFNKKSLGAILKKLNMEVVRMKTNTGDTGELGIELFSQFSGADERSTSSPVTMFYKRYRGLLRPFKLGTFKVIQVLFSAVGPTLNSLLVRLEAGEGLEVYAVKK